MKFGYHNTVSLHWNSRRWKDLSEFISPWFRFKRVVIRSKYGLFKHCSEPVKNQKWSFHKSIDNHTLKLSSNAFQFQKLSTRSKLQHTLNNVSAQCERADDIFNFLSCSSSRIQMFSNSKLKCFHLWPQLWPSTWRATIKASQKIYSIKHRGVNESD